MCNVVVLLKWKSCDAARQVRWLLLTRQGNSPLNDPCYDREKSICHFMRVQDQKTGLTSGGALVAAAQYAMSANPMGQSDRVLLGAERCLRLRLVHAVEWQGVNKRLLKTESWKPWFSLDSPSSLTSAVERKSTPFPRISFVIQGQWQQLIPSHQ